MVLWWERRRIAYNLTVGGVGFVSLILFLICITPEGVLAPGEEALEPLAVVFAPIAMNICYSAGWLLESLLRAVRPEHQRPFGPLLMRAGFAFSLIVVTLPSISWATYRLVQVLHIVR